MPLENVLLSSHAAFKIHSQFPQHYSAQGLLLLSPLGTGSVTATVSALGTIAWCPARGLSALAQAALGAQAIDRRQRFFLAPSLFPTTGSLEFSKPSSPKQRMPALTKYALTIRRL